MIDQKTAYDATGVKIKDDLLAGNAVVLFAYGLSGSGKTFTVFGVSTSRRRRTIGSSTSSTILLLVLV